jgi:hypothetical protein
LNLFSGSFSSGGTSLFSCSLFSTSHLLLLIFAFFTFKRDQTNLTFDWLYYFHSGLLIILIS